MFIITFTKVLPPDLFWATSVQLNPVYAFISCSTKFHFNIILFFCVYLPKNDLYPSGFQTKLCMNALLHTSYTLRPFRIIDLITLKVQGEEFSSSPHLIFPVISPYSNITVFKTMPCSTRPSSMIISNSRYQCEYILVFFNSSTF
jgi:hypothetical protein